MSIEIVEQPELLAVVIRVSRDSEQVREASAKLSELLKDHPAVSDHEHSYIFIPEWQWETEVTSLWVGRKVDRFENLPMELEMITIPTKRFARIKVHGDRAHVDAKYQELSDWFLNNVHEREVSVGSFGYEKGRLDTKGDALFEFEIYAPLVPEKPEGMLSPDFPGVIGAEVRKSKPRRLVGIEIDVDPKEENPSGPITRLWDQLLPRLREIADHKAPYGPIGVFLREEPLGPDRPFRYFGGKEIDPESTASLPDGMKEMTIPGDPVVVVTYRGTVQGFWQVWPFFYSHWFYKQTEFEPIGVYEYECYDHRFLGPDNENTVYEMHFPLRKLRRELKLTDEIVIDGDGHTLQDISHRHIGMASFQGSSLHGIDMRDTQLRHVNFVHSDWEHIYFAGLRIRSIQMGGTVFEDIRRPGEFSQLEGEPGTGDWVNVEPVVFRQSDLSTAKFESCDLRNVEIKDCQLEGLRIDGVLMTELLDNYRASRN